MAAGQRLSNYTFSSISSLLASFGLRSNQGNDDRKAVVEGAVVDLLASAEDLQSILATFGDVSITTHAAVTPRCPPSRINGSIDASSQEPRRDEF